MESTEIQGKYTSLYLKTGLTQRRSKCHHVDGDSAEELPTDDFITNRCGRNGSQQEVQPQDRNHQQPQ